MIRDPTSLREVPAVFVHTTLAASCFQLEPRYYECDLPDQTKVLLAIVNQGTVGEMWYLRISNRNLAQVLPGQFRVEAFVDRIYSYFKQRPNAEIVWTEEARSLWQGKSVGDQVKSWVARFKQGDPLAAASSGIGPMKLGLHATAMAIFDLGVGRYTAEDMAQADWQLRVTQDHVRRAKKLRLLVADVHDAPSVKQAITAYLNEQIAPPAVVPSAASFSVVVPGFVSPTPAPSMAPMTPLLRPESTMAPMPRIGAIAAMPPPQPVQSQILPSAAPSLLPAHVAAADVADPPAPVTPGPLAQEPSTPLGMPERKRRRPRPRRASSSDDAPPLVQPAIEPVIASVPPSPFAIVDDIVEHAGEELLAPVDALVPHSSILSAPPTPSLAVALPEDPVEQFWQPQSDPAQQPAGEPTRDDRLRALFAQDPACAAVMKAVCESMPSIATLGGLAANG